MIKTNLRVCLPILKRIYWYFDRKDVFLTLKVHSIVSRIAIQDTPDDDPKDLDRLIQDSVYTSCFAMHDGPVIESVSTTTRSHLSRVWSGWLRPQPIHEIRSYFGEAIAFHFAWLGHYTYWLLIAGIVGLLFFLYGLITAVSLLGSTNNPSNPALSSSQFYSDIFDNALTIPYAFFISLWGVLYAQFWSRRNNHLSAQWNTTDFLNEEKARPLWYATMERASPVTGEIEPHFPLRHRILLRGISLIAMAFMVAIVIGNVALYLFYSVGINYALKTYNPDAGIWAGFITSLISFLTMVLLRPALRYVSRRLNNLENHKTSTEYHGESILSDRHRLSDHKIPDSRFR